jgi:N-acetyl-gamma-glutamylphosphate reductase
MNVQNNASLKYVLALLRFKELAQKYVTETKFVLNPHCYSDEMILIIRALNDAEVAVDEAYDQLTADDKKLIELNS